MNSRIQHLIQHPFEVQLSDVAMLQSEIEKYPYFSTLRTLLLFGLKEYVHSSYQEELKKTSIYLPSRVALYHYLQKEKQEATEVLEDLEEEIQTFDESAELVLEQELIEEENFENEILENDAESWLAKNDSSAIEEETHSEKLVEENTTEALPKIDVNHSEMTFSQWLTMSKKSTEKSENTITDSVPSEKEIKFQLIEEFIEKSPKITPISKDIAQSPQVEKISPSEDYSDLMTETLAQIYTEQKKYEKAVLAYTILRIKYPEKSDYFQDKIEEIEILKNSK